MNAWEVASNGGLELGTQPEGEQRPGSWIVDPRHGTLQGKPICQILVLREPGRQYLRRTDPERRAQIKGLPEDIAEALRPVEAGGHQVQRQLVQQAKEAVRGERRSTRLPRRPAHEARDPFQPGGVYRRSHPFTVNRLSAKSPEGHSTGVISWSREQGKNTI